MNPFRTIAGPFTLSCLLILVCSAAPTVAEKTEATGNSYYFYTKVLSIDESGVVKVPPRYRWSVETSFRGVDLQGKDLPDSRVMLRLYDPDHNFTALTAQDGSEHGRSSASRPGPDHPQEAARRQLSASPAAL